MSQASLWAADNANGQRFATIDPNEQRAYDLAQSGVGSYNADLANAEKYTAAGAKTFPEADISAYMNPYIKNALDPAAREARLEAAQNINAAKGQAAMSGAFGGSRGTLLETEAARRGEQTVGDIYAKGYAGAFESAKDMFNRDRDAARAAAEQYRALGSQRQAQLGQDINTLMTTGGFQRALKQQGLDFNYQQFLTARDWDVGNLQPLLATVGSVPHSTTTVNAAKTSAVANIVGAAATVAGAFFGGPMGAAAGLKYWQSQQPDTGAIPIPQEGGGMGTAPSSWTNDQGNLDYSKSGFVLAPNLDIKPTFQNVGAMSYQP